jgi:hypothetical protein
MTHKRLIASLLLLTLSAVQVAAWAVALEQLDPQGPRRDLWQSLEALLAVVPEPALFALAGCVSIVIGVAVGMIGRQPRQQPTEHVVSLS